MRSSASLLGRLDRRLRVLFGVVAFTGIAVGTVVATQVAENAGASSASNGTGIFPNGTSYDAVEYNQQTGSSGAYYTYLKANSSGATVIDSMVSGGGCGNGGINPIITNPAPPLLNVTAANYSSGYPTPQPGGSLTGGTAAGVAASSNKTGVCSSQSGYQIQQNSALILGIGSDSNVANRIFAQAQINLANNSSSPSNVELVETFSGSVVGSETFSLAGGVTNAIADTGCGHGPVTTFPGGSTPESCTPGSAPPTGGFDTVQVWMTGPAGNSVTVVTAPNNKNPTSTATSIFYLAKQICPGQSISTTSTTPNVPQGSQVYVKITLDPADTGCKSYATFTANANDPETTTIGSTTYQTDKSIDFGAAGGTEHFTVYINWGEESGCQPSSSGTTVCPPTLVTLDGVNYTAQTFCSAATNPGDPLCTTSKEFFYSTYIDANQSPAVTYTPSNGSEDVVETWDGLTDWGFR